MRFLSKLDTLEFLYSLKENNPRWPQGVYFEITHRCNLCCNHCVNPIGNRDEKKEDELVLSDICKILDQLADVGCMWLVLSGGEPFIREDFQEIYRYAKRKGFLIIIFTNGTLITSKEIKLFEELPPFAIRVSMFGITEETYYKITKVEDSYYKFLNGITLLLKNNISTKVIILITIENKDEVIQIDEKIKGWKIPFEYKLNIAPRYNGEGAPERLNISLKEKKRIYSHFSQNQSRYFYSDNKKCRALLDCPVIDYKGNLLVCPLKRKKKYNLLGDDFKKIWFNNDLQGDKIICPLDNIEIL